ncbi:hypothetical protein [Burkholderia cepacia]|uniref:hypothetical protein n=1 Tax=Burkholderia cepacia TaxID=292 RepID=UPI0012D97463|nr:hypothetical protein [Burkholderia cepacia]
MLAVFGVRAGHGPTRTAGGSPKRAPRTMRDPEYRVSRFRYGTPRTTRRKAGNTRNGTPEAISGVPSTAAHARRIIFDIAPVFARGTFLQCLHGARFNLADGYVAT